MTLGLRLMTRASYLRELSGQGRGNGVEMKGAGAIMHRHLTAFAKVRFIAEALIRKLLQLKAAPHKHAGLAVLGKNLIV